MKFIVALITLSLTVSPLMAQSNAHSKANIHKIVVEEVLQTTSYTYLLGNENGQKQWLALPRIEASAGEVYYYQEGILMKDFKSTELDRTFASVLFLQSVQNAKTIEPNSDDEAQNPLAPDTPIGPVTPAKGGITIAELMANKASYRDKKVVIRGKVVKYNPGIMGKNWLHLQDGTEHEGDNDLTVTTDMTVKVGEIVTVEGIITLDKDFGAGYFYKLILEQAKIVE
jgi:hypothetical protein